MKRISIIILLSVLIFSCAKKEKVMQITVENPSDFDRIAELVEIPIDTVKSNLIVKDSLIYIVQDSEGNIIPSQVTYDRKIVFQPQLKAKESKSFIVSLGESQKYDAKTYGRFITERKDDFAWENDRVAFRIYGPALVEVDGPSNGIDVWYKRTNDLIIDKWYKDDLDGTASYHKDNGEGLDDYKVGRTLGAGAMAPYVNDKLWLNENFVKEELLDNGPLRTTFKLTYKDLDVNGKGISENRIISLDVGSQLTKVTQAYTIKQPMDVAAGIVKREKGDTAVFSSNYMIYGEPYSESVDNVYLAIVMPEGINRTLVDTYEIQHPKTNKKETHSHTLAVTSQQPNKPVTYYTGYGWSKFGFPTFASFQEYIDKFAVSINQPFIVKYNIK
ncbi:MAG: DUF4861 family protein [Dysgonomonas sp.]